MRGQSRADDGGMNTGFVSEKRAIKDYEIPNYTHNRRSKGRRSLIIKRAQASFISRT